MIGQLRELVSKFDRELDAAHGLFSWLPSATVGKLFHGDYYIEWVYPLNVMQEACTLISYYRGYEISWDDLIACPCGEEDCIYNEGENLSDDFPELHRFFFAGFKNSPLSDKDAPKIETQGTPEWVAWQCGLKRREWYLEHISDNIPQ